MLFRCDSVRYTVCVEWICLALGKFMTQFS